MFLNRKILALIPARGGSKGIKLKNLKKINNLSLLAHTSKFIDKCKFFDDKFVSTESKKIINEANKLGAKIFKRSKLTSKDYTSDFEVISEVLNDKLIQKSKYDFVIYLQPTSPIRKISQIKKALSIVIKKKYDTSWSITKIDKKFHPKKILKISKDNFLSIYNNEGKKIFARQQLEDIYIRNGIFYIFRVSKLLKSKNIFMKKNYPSITNYLSVNIDTQEDLKKAKKMIN
ncbi:acylneuraminate cytidylyltransferase family protein [Candidatus Pelagibacter sp.]|nr:acylneuraminate cytidylyltransferase family protein [Candidatus Pelagibacter sp.]